MPSSAAMRVVEMLGSPKRLYSARAASRMRWGVRRGGLAAMAKSI